MPLIDPLGLSFQQLIDVFPFHIALDLDLKITQVGRVIDQIYPCPLINTSLHEHFVIDRPKGTLTAEAIHKKINALFLLSSQDLPLPLKGQMIPLLDQAGFLFLCSPSIIHAEQLGAVGIKLKDFPVHDSTPDLIFLQNTTRISIQQIEDLNRQLSKTEAELRQALKIQEELRLKAEQQTQQLEKQLQEIQQTQIHLVQSEKMSALGQLLSGIIHEINNPFQFIHGNLHHCLEYIEELDAFFSLIKLNSNSANPKSLDSKESLNFNNFNGQDLESILFVLEDFPKLIHSMKVGAERVRQVINGLRTFSRQDASLLEEFHVPEAIDNTLMILKSRLEKSTKQPIKIIKNYDSFSYIYCYSGQLNQVLMNIIGNAIDALEDFCQTLDDLAADPFNASDQDNVYCPTIWIETHLVDQNWFSISIRDNGCGIPEEVKSRIFEPFFTTKSAERGTGLGMSISYKIVTERHGGRLMCNSQINQGTEFLIELPIQPLSGIPR